MDELANVNLYVSLSRFSTSLMFLLLLEKQDAAFYLSFKRAEFFKKVVTFGRARLLPKTFDFGEAF